MNDTRRNPDGSTTVGILADVKPPKKEEKPEKAEKKPKTGKKS